MVVCSLCFGNDETTRMDNEPLLSPIAKGGGNDDENDEDVEDDDIDNSEREGRKTRDLTSLPTLARYTITSPISLSFLPTPLHLLLQRRKTD